MRAYSISIGSPCRCTKPTSKGGQHCVTERSDTQKSIGKGVGKIVRVEDLGWKRKAGGAGLSNTWLNVHAEEEGDGKECVWGWEVCGVGKGGDGRVGRVGRGESGDGKEGKGGVGKERAGWRRGG